MNHLFYSIFLLLIFYIVLIGEFLLPTGGILGAIAFAAFVGSVVFAFKFSTLAGICVTSFIVITTPVFILFLIRIWPYTPVGRRMLNIRPGETADLPRKTTSKGTPLDDLIGQHGVAKNNLLPSGMILVNGENIDAVSTGMPIDSGTPIIITKVDTGHLYVRALTSAELTSQNPSAPTSPPLLEDSLESFDFD
jgi:membrane-bound ClpP family serine protease